MNDGIFPVKAGQSVDTPTGWTEKVMNDGIFPVRVGQTVDTPTE